MTVLIDSACLKTFVTASPKKDDEIVKCPYCNHTGKVIIIPTGNFKGEGSI